MNDSFGIFTNFYAIYVILFNKFKENTIPSKKIH